MVCDFGSLIALVRDLSYRQFQIRGYSQRSAVHGVASTLNRGCQCASVASLHRYAARRATAWRSAAKREIFSAKKKTMSRRFTRALPFVASLLWTVAASAQPI